MRYVMSQSGILFTVPNVNYYLYQCYSKHLESIIIVILCVYIPSKVLKKRHTFAIYLTETTMANNFLIIEENKLFETAVKSNGCIGCINIVYCHLHVITWLHVTE